MITGHFDAGSPYVEGFVELRGLRTDGRVTFLLDTGADVTCIMPQDGHWLGMDYTRIKRWDSPTRGVGGSVRAARRRAQVWFTEDSGVVRQYSLLIDIMPDLESLQGLPSLLGQDILAHWRVVHEPASELLRITVRSADRTIRR